MKSTDQEQKGLCLLYLRGIMLVVLLLALCGLTGCGAPLSGDDPGSTDIATNSLDSASVNLLSLLSVQPQTGKLIPGGVISLVASGGVPPYKFAILSGSATFAPAGPSSAVVIAGVTFGTVVVGVTDKAGASTLSTILIAPVSGAP